MCSLQHDCTNIPPTPKKKCSNHVKIPEAKMVTQSNFHAENAQILGALCVISGFRSEVD